MGCTNSKQPQVEDKEFQNVPSSPANFRQSSTNCPDCLLPYRRLYFFVTTPEKLSSENQPFCTCLDVSEIEPAHTKKRINLFRFPRRSQHIRLNSLDLSFANDSKFGLSRETTLQHEYNGPCLRIFEDLPFAPINKPNQDGVDGLRYARLGESTRGKVRIMRIMGTKVEDLI